MEPKKISPYNFKLFTKEEKCEHNKYHTKDTHDYIRVGPAGYVLPSHFLTHADAVHDMPLRTDDIFVVSYPRSGTTWTQELVWLLANDLDYETAGSISLEERFPFLEFYMFFRADEVNEDQKRNKIWEKYCRPATETLSAMTSQRFIKTHLPLSLLPADTLDTSKVVYVARDMRDVAVSVYYFYKSFKLYDIQCEFNDYYENMFSKKMLKYAPYFDHIKEAWALRAHPNMLFLFYEELSKDLQSTTSRVAKFLGKHYTDKQLKALCDHVTFDKFQNNKSVTSLITDFKQIGVMDQTDNNFIRKGKTGDWRDHFSEEMKQHAERWIYEQLHETGLKF